MQQRAARWLIFMLYAAGVIGIAWLSVKLILPFLSPFILAYLLAAAMEKPVRFMVRHGYRRRASAGLFTVLLLACAGWAAWLITVKGAGAVTDFAKCAPEFVAALGRKTEALEAHLSAYLSAVPGGTDGHISAALGALTEEIYGIPVILSQKLIDLLARTAQSGPDTVLYLVTFILGTYFISASFPRTNAFLLAQLPEALRRRLTGLGGDIRACFGGFFRAQIILMGITFFELVAAFAAMKIKNSLALAAVTAAVDALPVFGTGTVLLPWAVYELILGDSVRAVLLCVLWGGTNLVRSTLQARLLGAQIGLDPLSSLLAVYVGWRIWKVWGMLLFPIIFAVAAQLNEKGIIRLWKTV